MTGPHHGFRKELETVDKPAETKKDLAGTRPLQVVELRQLLPCIADSSKFRIIARFEPPLEGALKLLEPLFPRARYSDRIGALIIQRGNILITIYSTGSVTMTMIKSEAEAREVLEDLKKTINEAIAKGVTPVPREKVKVDHAEIYQYLPAPTARSAASRAAMPLPSSWWAGDRD